MVVRVVLYVVVSPKWVVLYVVVTPWWVVLYGGDPPGG